MKPIPIGELTDAVRKGRARIEYRVAIKHLELFTYESIDYVWIKRGNEEAQCIHNPTLAEAIRERCEG
jgi:hypothetical protein